jgi:sortase (surface protein transpeptidase)
VRNPGEAKGRRRGAWRVIAVASVAAVAAVLGWATRAGDETRPFSSTPAVGRQSTTLPAANRTQIPIPIRIVIPAIGVDARIEQLGLNLDRTMQVPDTLADAGWFQPGPEPGETGAAVIVGHLNSTRGPGVFSHLSSLRRGQLIVVYLRDGSRVRFVARSMLRVSKSRFPTKLVYAKTAKPTLRVITCAGWLNPATGHHADNYIVFATLLDVRRSTHAGLNA